MSKKEVVFALKEIPNYEKDMTSFWGILNKKQRIA